MTLSKEDRKLALNMSRERWPLTYQGVHKWVNKMKPRRGFCSRCHKSGRTHWANKNGREYRKVPSDYIELCAKCHSLFDRNGQKWPD